MPLKITKNNIDYHSKNYYMRYNVGDNQNKLHDITCDINTFKQIKTFFGKELLKGLKILLRLKI